MPRDAMTEDEAKRRFAEATDALNRRAQAEGPAPDSAARMRAIIADHRLRCAALSAAERVPQDVGGEAKRGEP